MEYENSVAICNDVAITATGWTDIGGNAVGAYSLPMSCNQVVVINTSAVAITLATNPNLARSTVNVPSGASWSLGVPSWGPRLGGPRSAARFVKSSEDAACSLKSTNGNVTVCLELVL